MATIAAERSFGIIAIITLLTIVRLQGALVIVVASLTVRIQSVSCTATLETRATVTANGVVTALCRQTVVIIHRALVDI